MTTTVEAVMTADVVVVPETASFKQIVHVLRVYGVNAAPVLGADGTVTGVVSATDLLLKEADPDAAEDSPLFAGPRRRKEIRKSAGTVAADLMTSPAITIAPTAPVEQAARVMRREHVSRLPVIDQKSGRLVGIVSRADLLRVYSRPDRDIHDDVVRNVIVGRFGWEAERYAVTVKQGQVTVEGDLERRSQIPALLHAIRRVEGVVAAEARLNWTVDDTYIQHYPMY
ncbi:CBS domain-containing protein [Spirillospora sp. NPDC048911]|uniref:CBS domain-containing protein n=1 Tax=Spirillospora sp. NPDC048911 TaxID=3364527 RepID=UPI00371F885F